MGKVELLLALASPISVEEADPRSTVEESRTAAQIVSACLSDSDSCYGEWRGISFVIEQQSNFIIAGNGGGDPLYWSLACESNPMTDQRSCMLLNSGSVALELSSVGERLSVSSGYTFPGTQEAIRVDGGKPSYTPEGRSMSVAQSKLLLEEMEGGETVVTSSVAWPLKNDVFGKASLKGFADTLALARQIYARFRAGDALPASVAVPQGLSKIRISDYPVRALRLGIEGDVSIEARFDGRGALEGCKILSSSGDVELDEVTCRLVSGFYRRELGPRGGVLRRTFEWRIPE